MGIPLIATALMLSASLPGHASMVQFTAMTGGRAASATFSQLAPGGDLTVLLTNTSLSDVLVPVDVLTAVFFKLAGNPALTPMSAVLAGGSTVLYDPQGQPVDGVVGGEWAYKAANPPTVGGISSSGLGVFGTGNLFPGDDLAAPLTPDGLQYGLLSAGDDATTGNGGITGSGGLIKNSVLFTLGAAGFTLSEGSISDVSFQYGTDLLQPNIVASAVPLPLAGWLLGSGLVALGLVRRRDNGSATNA